MEFLFANNGNFNKTSMILQISASYNAQYKKLWFMAWIVKQ